MSGWTGANPEKGGSLPRFFKRQESTEKSSWSPAVPPRRASKSVIRSALDFSDSNLSSLPPDAFIRSDTVIFCANRNQLTNIPRNIESLQSLEELSLSYNQLASFPSSVIALTKLQHLEFSHNNISSIPNDISNLTKLQVLQFSHNKLETLPQGIGDLNNLCILTLKKFHEG